MASSITVQLHQVLERVLSIEIVRVTERAAVSAARLRGHGKDKASDQAAVDAMRRELNKLPIDGTVVIGEGELDEAPMQRHEGGYYIRMLAVDKPGTAATIAKRLAQHNISMESIVQRHRGPPAGGAEKGKGPVPVIIITYATTEDAVRKALAAVQRDKVISGRPQLIRIEKN